MVVVIRRYVLVAILVVSIASYTQAQGYAAYQCPTGWEEFGEHCYKFVQHPRESIDAFKQACIRDGAYGLSVNTADENNFLSNTLERIAGGARRPDWWTSGRREQQDSMQFMWEGDGTKVESFFYWHNASIPTDKTKTYIKYHYNGQRWAWILSEGFPTQKYPFICEISKEDVYKIANEERGPGYGLTEPDPTKWERGPRFYLQPQHTVYENADVNDFVSMECAADALPAPTYEWFQERAGQIVKIDPQKEKRYTLINGRLIIDKPTVDRNDDGNYHCQCFNKFGRILSNQVALSFGYLQDFPKSPRAPVTAISYQWATIECNPPSHYPRVLYAWYKDDIFNFIRPELKPYIMISHDGRLYFSEVTSDDIGQYYCIVYKPGQALAQGKVSMPTKLNVVEGSPGVYEPGIGSGFPKVVEPKSPKLGDTVRIECWATGSYRYGKLIYTWDKVEMDEGGRVTRILELPPQSRRIDHNRVLLIPNVQFYDGGLYRCHVRRPHGQTASATVNLILEAEPYFTLALKDQYADQAGTLTWRCEGGGVPPITYFWMRDGQHLNNATLPPGDRGRFSINNNVLTIRDLQAKDAGMYQCSAYNIYTTRYSSGQLRVLAFKPNFAKYPLLPNQFGALRGNTTLLCRPEAAPYPLLENIVWYKNDAPLNPGEDEGSRVRKLPSGHLFINNLVQGDGGVYRCQVRNPLGSASTTGNLTILSETVIARAPERTVIRVNRTRFVHCMASYDEILDVTYTWHQNGQLIEFEKVLRLGENNYQIWRHPYFFRGRGLYNGGLYITNAQHEQQGRYTCTVYSASSKMSRSADVLIVGPPFEPAGCYHDPATVTSTSVLIKWKVGGDNGQPITSYVVEGINGYEGFWKVVISNIFVPPDSFGTLEYNVTNLHPNSHYQLRVRAENLHGTSEPSSPTEAFTTLPIKVFNPPTEVGGGGGKVGDLTVTWRPLPPWLWNGPNFGYRVRYKVLGDEQWMHTDTIPDGNAAKHVFLVGEANYYRQYEVQVVAFNDLGPGPWSEVATIRSAMGLPTAIAEDVRAQPYNSTACLVHWVPVQDTRDHLKGKLGGYRISYWIPGVELKEVSPRVTIDGQAEQGLVIGLYPDTEYRFDVMVWNEAGNGPQSSYFDQRTLRQAPMNQPVEVQVYRQGSNAIHATWRGVSTTSEEEPLEGYKVRIWRDGEHIKVAQDYDAEKETDLYIDGLRDDVVYKLRVLGYSRGGDGTQSSPAIKFYLGAASSASSSTVLTLLTLTVTSLLWR